jgi:chitinase
MMNLPAPCRRLFFCLLLTLLFSTAAQAQRKVVAYVPNWIELDAFAETIDYAKLTHINIAFENPLNASGELSWNPQNDGLIAKARAGQVKVLVSIGGGSASEDKVMRKHYADLLSPAKRAGFVSRIAEFISAHGLDGLDVDIEGPSITEDYGAFIHELSAALKPKGKLLTAALSQGYGGERVSETVFESFDFINIMAYDGAGYWEPKAPGQHSSLEFAQSNLDYWLKRGLPKTKAVLGLPFYGYGFGKDFRKRDYSYADIHAKYPGAEKVDQIGSTIWYNGIPTIQAKTKLVMEEGLAGVMIWSLDSDVKGEHSLLSAIHATLKGKAP